jgi:replicative DNA helicase
MELAFFALAQINRGVESRDDKRPRMSDIRESGAIENHADQVWLMYRDEYYKPETCDRGIIEINVGKNRDGLTGMAKLLFLPQYSIFRNLKR